MDEQEEYTMILNKVIQDYMLNTYRSTNDQEAFNNVFSSFYTMLETKAAMVKHLWNEQWQKNALIEYDVKQDPRRVEPIKCNPHKKVTMRYSLIYYVDIMTHIMLLIDEKILNDNKVLLDRVKGILNDLLQGFCQLDYKTLKGKMDPVYFDNLFFVANKNLSLVSMLIKKCKMKRVPQGTHGLNEVAIG